jgi:hypothetical protein
MVKESEKFYRSIIDRDHDSRLKRSLESIKNVCDEIERYSGRIYVNRVGKLCLEQFGGPVAQSIRNKPDILKRYVDLRAAEQSLPGRIKQKDNRINISDPKIRAYTLLLEEQVRDYEEQIRILKNLLMRIAPVEIDKLIAEAFSNGSPLALPLISNESSNGVGNSSNLTEPARRALGKIINEAHLKLFRLSLYKGRVVDEMRRKFLEKDEYQALLKLLGVGDSGSHIHQSRDET